MRLLDFVICDDIRNELGNKLSLMGVYTGTYIIPDTIVKWPFPTRFGFFIRLLAEGEQPGHEFEFHIMRSGETKVKIDGSNPEFRSRQAIHHPFQSEPLSHQGSGDLGFRNTISKRHGSDFHSPLKS